MPEEFRTKVLDLAAAARGKQSYQALDWDVMSKLKGVTLVLTLAGLLLKQDEKIKALEQRLAAVERTKRH